MKRPERSSVMRVSNRPALLAISQLANANAQHVILIVHPRIWTLQQDASFEPVAFRSITVVPEPSAYLLGVFSFLSLAGVRKVLHRSKRGCN
jgi:hypothetical protein